MCSLCEENNGEMLSCQDCGRLICFDVEANQGDDIIRSAYVTSSGDLFCDFCGRRYDEAEQQMMEAEAAYFPYDPMDI